MDKSEISRFRYWIAVTLWAVTLFVLVLSTGLMVFSAPDMNAYIDDYNYSLLVSSINEIEFESNQFIPNLITIVLVLILFFMILVQVVRAWLDMGKVSWFMILSLVRNEKKAEEADSLFFDLLLFNERIEFLSETEDLELDPEDAKSSLIGRVLIRIGKAWALFIVSHIVAVIPYFLLMIYYLMVGKDAI